MNTFKIVSTKEKRGVYFTAVPHKWEKSNILSWPEHLPHSQREALRSNSSSEPEEEWSKHECVLKFKNIKTFPSALALEKQLTDCVDTEAEEELFQNLSKTNSKKTFEFIDKNNLFEPDVQIENIPVIFEETNELVSQHLPDITILAQDISSIKSDIDEIKTEMTNIKKEMKSEYVKVSVLFDKIIEKIGNIETPVTVSDSLNSKSNEDLLQKYDFPLKTTDEVASLDAEIRTNSILKTELINFLCTIAGTTGHADASKLVYKIFDCLILPQVLTHYTWTGISRKKDNLEKKAFHTFEGILDTLFKVLLKADNRHTKEKNEKLIKDGILKHAKKRSERKSKILKKNNVEEDPLESHEIGIDVPLDGLDLGENQLLNNNMDDPKNEI